MYHAVYFRQVTCFMQSQNTHNINQLVSTVHLRH